MSAGEVALRMSDITNTSFVIAVPDWQKSAAFYRDVLGFTIHSVSDPGWLFYRRGACTIMAGECPDALPPRRLGGYSCFACWQVTHIDLPHESVRSAGARIPKTIRDEHLAGAGVWRGHGRRASHHVWSADCECTPRFLNFTGANSHYRAC